MNFIAVFVFFVTSGFGRKRWDLETSLANDFIFPRVGTRPAPACSKQLAADLFLSIKKVLKIPKAITSSFSLRYQYIVNWSGEENKANHQAGDIVVLIYLHQIPRPIKLSEVWQSLRKFNISMHRFISYEL